MLSARTKLVNFPKNSTSLECELKAAATTKNKEVKQVQLSRLIGSLRFFVMRYNLFFTSYYFYIFSFVHRKLHIVQTYRSLLFHEKFNLKSSEGKKLISNFSHATGRGTQLKCECLSTNFWIRGKNSWRLLWNYIWFFNALEDRNGSDQKSFVGQIREK